jgi:hypothetical protein
MIERHAEFESTTLRLGMQVGQERCDRWMGSPDLIPNFFVGWNWRVYFGFTLRWLLWYVGFYIITPAYVKEIKKRREFLAAQEAAGIKFPKMDAFLKGLQ